MNAADRDAALVHQYGPGLVIMEECPICGTLWWRTTHTGMPNGVQITAAENNNAECLPCTEAFRRAPELYNWVVRVVSNTVRKALVKPPEVKP